MGKKTYFSDKKMKKKRKKIIPDFFQKKSLLEKLFKIYLSNFLFFRILQKQEEKRT